MPHFLQVRRASSFQKSSIAWLKCCDDVAAIEVDVFHQRPAIFAVENDVLVFARRATAFDHHAERIRRADRRVRHVRRDEECFAFAHQMIDDPIAFTDAHFDVAL